MKPLGTTKDRTALEGSGLQAEMASVKPVQRRFLIPLAGVCLLLVVGFGLGMFKTQQKSMDYVSRQVLEDTADELSESLVEQSDALSTFADILIHDAGLRDALKTRNRQRLLAEYQPVFTQLRGESGITHFYFHRSDRVNLLRLHKPDAHGDLIDRFTAREAEHTGKTVAGIELGQLGTFTLRVVQPVFDGDMLLGYLELGKEIEDVLERIHDEHGIELATTINKNYIEREKWESGMKMLGRTADWDRYADDVLIYSSLDPFPPETDLCVSEAGHTHHEITIETAFGAGPWRVLVSTLNDASGAEVGNLIILQDISKVRAAFHRLVAVSVGAALVLLSTLFGFMFVILRRVDRGLCEQQADLARSEKFQRTLIETSPDFIFVLDTDGTIRKVNRVLPGHREEGVVGQKAVMFVPPEYQDAFEETFRQAIDTRQLQTLETAMDLPDGRHYFLNRLNPLSLTDEECSIVLIATDITERKRAEEALRESEKTHRGLTENLPQRIFHKDTNSVYVSCNKHYAKDMGITPDEITGKTDFDFYPKELAEKYRADDRRLMESGHTEEIEETYFKDDQEFTVQTVKTPLTDGANNVTGILGIFWDITERKRAEEDRKCLEKSLFQSDKMASIGRLAAGVAHEINNPMGFISSNLNTMNKYLRKLIKHVTGDDSKSPESREQIKEMTEDFGDAISESLEGADRIKKIVADLKSFSRVDAGMVEYANLNEGLETTLNIVWNQLKYRCKVEKELGNIPKIECFPNKINQVFMNLLVNAGDAFKGESGLITIKTWADDDHVHVSIRDNGCGIPKENLPKLFDAFFTTKEVGKGTGLGLSLTYDIVSKHGGTITVDSEVGKGTEFVVTLPISSKPEPASIPTV